MSKDCLYHYIILGTYSGSSLTNCHHHQTHHLNLLHPVKRKQELIPLVNIYFTLMQVINTLFNGFVPHLPLGVSGYGIGICEIWA